MDYPNVTVIMANWNGGDKIIRCLDSVKKLDYPSFDVIIIDNNSTDGSKEKIKKQFKQFKIIENKSNLGCVKAINQGLSHAKGPLILRLDDDVLLDKDLLKKMVEVIKSKENIGIVIPKLCYYKNPKMFDNLGFSINPITCKTNSERIDKIDKGQFEEQKEVDFVPGSVLLTKKEVVKKVGLLDPAYFIFYEDVDWCWKVRRAGYKIIYTPKTKALHDCNKKEMNKFKVFHYNRSKIIFMKKNIKQPKKLLFFLFFLFVYSPLKFTTYILKRKSSLIKSHIKGFKEGFFIK
jgi:GT2 family glycosyltransferase